ncbi:MAG: ATP-binding cassette domain-containing protein [Candidatus Bipolaricaulota bacterium]|nr:sugar ABC transporter ATP-binding protein [Candidatus Bipolaricaulota bacterium]
MSKNQLVEMKGIKKRFGEVKALKGVDFEVGENEIVGLVGDNGAGKTTLIKILTGIYKPDAGQIYYRGEERSFSSPRESRNWGIETIHQEMALIDDMTIKENFFLGKTPTRKIAGVNFLDEDRMEKICREALEEVGIEFGSLDKTVAPLSGGERKAIAIARSMYFGKNLAVMDEPTAALSLEETQRVLDYIKSIKKENMSGILISHLTRHVYPAADRFVILDSGRKTGDFTKGDISREELEKLIVSGRMSETGQKTDNTS